MNVYAYEVATGRLKQVTNVVNGAYQPEPSPDGKSLAYVGYTHEGYDVFVIPLDETQWLDPLPYVETRPAPPARAAARRVHAPPYNPLHDARCRARTRCKITPGNFGQATIVTARRAATSPGSTRSPRASRPSGSTRNCRRTSRTRIGRCRST